MKFLNKKTLLFVASLCMVFGYQNCGESPSAYSELESLPTNIAEIEFLEKIFEDADLLVNNNRGQLCLMVEPDCVKNNRRDLSCIRETIEAYYEGLECAGFTVAADKDCYLAVSKSEGPAMRPLLIDMTCFGEENRPVKALHLDTCHGTDVGFSTDGPSTGMKISAWMELGNQYPFSRQRMEVMIYPNQKEITLSAHIMGEGNAMVDACGKTKVTSPTGLEMDIIQLDQ